jgi:hypothetical protein
MPESPSPSAYREKNPYNPPPPDYKPPSFLWEHKGLAILFAAVPIAFAAYFLTTPHTANRAGSSAAAAGPGHSSPAATVAGADRAPDAPRTRNASGPQPPQPIYIETIPEKDTR